MSFAYTDDKQVRIQYYISNEDKAGNTTGINVTVDKEHTISDWIIDKEATVDETGKRHKEYTVCGNVMVTEDIDKLEKPTEEVTEKPTVTTKHNDKSAKTADYTTIKNKILAN